ncbi:DoxX family membrane protein [Halalkalibacter urbisdiaboli]|uniref:DoxX family membrane protein n=1 Tax=Halalkalibacter urbisdiaboli TaxID=1960589 RepID=UPI000B45031A|nr:DoxX family membrane protein [Halalkalibacter urbisdiaboli]
MNILILVSRIILGFIFFVAGVNGFFVLAGLEPFFSTSEQAMALFEYQFLLVFVKAFEVIFGVLLLMNRYVSLALAMLLPITANIFLLHLLVDHSLLPLALLLIACHGYLIYMYRNNFSGLLKK